MALTPHPTHSLLRFQSTYKYNVVRPLPRDPHHSPTNHPILPQVMSCSGCSGAVDRVLKKTESALPPLSRFPPLHWR